MKIFIGLGNPGEKYIKNRHNIGFLIVDEISKSYGRATWVNKFLGKFSECQLNNEKFLLLKPQTFMNNSGNSVKKILDFYKVQSNNIIVFHDDLDLRLGQIKIKKSGGHAGHNGLKSIHAAIGEHYNRVRIGIGHPGDKSKVASYVLSNFAKSENEWLDNTLRGCTARIPNLLSEDYINFVRLLSSDSSAIDHTHKPKFNQKESMPLSKNRTSTQDLTITDKQSSMTLLEKLIKKFT